MTVLECFPAPLCPQAQRGIRFGGALAFFVDEDRSRSSLVNSAAPRHITVDENIDNHRGRCSSFECAVLELLGVEMKARQLMDGASYGPAALKVIGQAFDEAWQSIEGNFGNDPRDVERARIRLATALLSVASEDSRDIEALKRGALQAMALNYRNRPAREPV